MATIHHDDTILATLEGNGRIMASIHRNGFANVDEVVNFALATGGQFDGLAKLNMRNKTQGWNMTICLASRRKRPATPTLRARAASITSASKQTMPRQLSIEW